MEFKDVMFDILKYIETNINKPITADDIAKNSGYSLFYFSRMFKKQMGLSVMEYVKDRKLIKASEEILHGKKILDVALDLGYQSHSGFTKAFKNKFGFSPLLLREYSLHINRMDSNFNMGHVFMRNTYIYATKEELYGLLVSIIEQSMLDYNKENIRKAYELACTAHEGSKRSFGADFVTHPINVAIILSEMKASEDAVIAGLLHDIIFKRTNISIEKIKDEFSERVANIIEEVTGFIEKENITDEDVMKVKLADRLHNMRTINISDEMRCKEKAKQTLYVFSPIAAKLNDEKVMAELNDLSVKYI